MSPRYSAFGVCLESELSFPELPPTTDPPDVHVRFARVAPHLEQPRATGVLFEAAPGRFLLSIKGIARYEVRDGREVLVDRSANAIDSDVRGFLLSSAFGALLHQRGTLPLHASAVATPAGAVLFAGHSGLGKSTVLGEFVRRGYRMVSDDITGLTIDAADAPVVHAGVPQMRMWGDTAGRLNYLVDRLQRVRPNLRKYVVPALSGFAAEAQPLAAIYILHRDNGATVRLQPYRGGSRASVISEHTFGRRFVAGLGMESRHFGLVSALANRVPVVAVHRPRAPFLLDELADRIIHDLG